MDALMSASHVVSSIPPAGLPLYDPVTRAQLALLRRRAEAAAAGDAPPLQWLGVLSSTSVYGDHGGGWVDEERVFGGGCWEESVQGSSHVEA